MVSKKAVAIIVGIGIVGSSGYLIYKAYAQQQQAPKPITQPMIPTPSPTNECVVRYGYLDESDAQLRINIANQQIQKYQSIIDELNQLMQEYGSEYVVLYAPNGTPLYYPYWTHLNVSYIQINVPDLGGEIALYSSQSDAEVARQAWLIYQPQAVVINFGQYLKGVIAGYQYSIMVNQQEIETIKTCLKYFESISQ